MLVRAAHPANASEPMLVTLEGTETPVTFESPLNALAPIEVTFEVDVNETVVTPEQPSNALVPIDVVVVGIVIFVRAEQL